MPKKPSAPSYQQVILAGAIAIVLVAFVMYALHTFYKEPQYNDFCQEPQPVFRDNQEACEAEQGRWNPQPGPCPEKGPCGWCEYDYACRKDYEQAIKPHKRNRFIIISTIGVLLVVTGLLLKLAAVSGGISVGGVILLIIAVVGYWDEFGEYVRLLLLGLLLAALIFIAYKKFGK